MTDPAPFDPSAVGTQSAAKRVSWTSRDCMLYALGVGAGPDDLAFTTNNTKNVPQRMFPTMPVTLGVDFSVLKTAGKFDWANVLHAEQQVEILADLPVNGEAQAITEITEMWDKGKAALIVARTTATSLDGTTLWRSSAGLFIRGVGGWDGKRGPESNTPQPQATETSKKTMSLQTRPEQALLYRLSGDYNPLHSDPSFARRAGLGNPILHGLCTFGFAGRAVLKSYAEDRRLTSMSARFAGPVWPGDLLKIDLMRIDEQQISFSARGRDGQVVLTGGLATVK